MAYLRRILDTIRSGIGGPALCTVGGAIGLLLGFGLRIDAQGVGFSLIIQNGGTAKGAVVTLNCDGTTATCTVSGGVVTISATGTGGSVTSVAGGCSLAGGPVTTTGTLSQAQPINLQTMTTYTFLATDCGKLVSQSNAGAIADSLPVASTSGFGTGWYMDVENTGAGTVTITPTTSTIDGAATLVLPTNQGARIASNGTNYFTVRGITVAGGTTNQNIRSIGAGFDGGGSALTSGATQTAYFTVPFACTIAAWNITVDTGTITFDVWKIATGTAIPTVANTITASALPAISTGTAVHSTTLTGWTTSVSANDIFGVNINAVSSATKASLVLQCNAP